jgi:DNA-binding transcriptional LysR family regulator
MKQIGRQGENGSLGIADLNTLVIFAHVGEARSFSEAARRLEIPLSTVSRRIAELEAQLGVRLIERSTRHLRLTDTGSEVLEQARRGAEICQIVNDIVSDKKTNLSGELRLSAPPSISDSLLAPVVGAFQIAYPRVRVQIFITDRIVDQIAEGIDVAFKVGTLKDSSLVARTILRYRHQLVCSPRYLKEFGAPEKPQDLLRHRLLAFSFWRPVSQWQFAHVSGKEQENISFRPYLAMNDYAGLATAMLADMGIGDFPPIVQPDLVRKGLLVEVMPNWHFPNFDLSVVHVGGKYISRVVRVFKEFAVKMVPTLFPKLPS